MTSSLLGTIFALITALSSSAANFQVTRLNSVSPALLTFLKFCVGAVCALLLISIGYFGSWTVTNPLFFLFVIVAIPFEYLITYLQTRAYQTSEQSLVGPLWGTSAIFALPLGAIFLGENPTWWGVGGVCMIVVGTCVIGYRTGDKMLWVLKNILKEKGAMYMFLAALCGAVATIIAKSAFVYASPALYLLCISACTALVGVRSAVKASAFASTQGKGYRIFFLLWTQGVLLVTHFIGLSLLPAAYFLSMKRSSVLFDVFIGKFLNKDGQFFTRLPGAILIFGGILLTLLKG